MRRIANFIILIVLFAFGFTMIFSRMANVESLKINNALRQDSYTIDFVKIGEKNQRVAFDTVRKVAKEEKLNIYQYDWNDAQHITLFLELNYHKAKMLKTLHATENLGRPNLKSFVSEKNAYTLKPIEKIFSEVGYVTNLMVQGSPSAVEKLQAALSPYYSQPLQPESPAQDNLALLLVQILVTALVFGLVVSLFLVDFYQSYRDLNVKLLQGYSKLSLLLQILRENYLLPVLGADLIITAIIFIFPHLFSVFVWTYLLTLLGIFVSLAVTLLVLRNYKISPEILNGRNPQKSVSRINRILSVLSSAVIALSLIFFGNMVTHLAGQMLGEAQVNKVFSAYSASSLIHIDLETESDSSKQIQHNLQETSWLKSQLQNQAILHLDNNTEDKSFLKHEKLISSAYLRHFPIYDSDGKRVKVKENETSLVELVPIGLKNKTPEISSQVTQNHASISFGPYEEATKEQVSSPINVKIIYIKPGRSPFDLTESNRQTIYRVLTSSNISPYSIYGDLFIGATSSGGLYLKKANPEPEGGGYVNDSDKTMGLSLGRSADEVYSASVDFQIKTLLPFVIALIISLIIYFFSLFFGFHQFRKLGKDVIRTKVLLGMQKRNLHLPYLLYHFVFSFVLAGIGIAISNFYIVILAVLLFGLVLVIFIWSGRKEKNL